MKRGLLAVCIIEIIFCFSISVHAREVLSWVPPYDVSICYNTLIADFGAYSPKNVMTGLGLQFWRPTNTGTLVYEIDVGDSDVTKFRAKCTEYGIKLLLCVYNNNQQNPGWDWNLAVKAFKDNRSTFVNALYNECKRLNLDGVDIDLEGLGGHDADRQAFALFIKELGAKLHAAGLILTVDTFHSPCYNAPNMAWWKDWIGYVDYIHSMGYAELWESNTKTLSDCPSDPAEDGKMFFKYSYQSQYGLKSGLKKTVVSVGMPSSNNWGDGYVRDHVQDVISLSSPTGICIWDFTLKGGQWRESATWQLIKKLVDLDTATTEIVTAPVKKNMEKFAAVSVSKNRIELIVAQKGQYTISFYNAAGQLYQTIDKKSFEPGIYQLPLLCDAAGNGVYFITISKDKKTLSQKIVISR